MITIIRLVSDVALAVADWLAPTINFPPVEAQWVYYAAGDYKMARGARQIAKMANCEPSESMEGCQLCITKARWEWKQIHHDLSRLHQNTNVIQHEDEILDAMETIYRHGL